MSLYTPYSNYIEMNQEYREVIADEEPHFWGSRSDEYRRYRQQWNLAQQDSNFVPKIPLCVTIDASSLCNLRCLGCHQSIPGAITDAGRLAFDDAKRIIDQCAEIGVPSVSFAWKGEPSLNKELPEMVAYCIKKGILETRTVTNCLSPHEDIYIKLCEAGLHRLIISVDGHSKETFETYRRGSNWERLNFNIEKILAWKAEHNSDFPLIRIQCVRNKLNKDEIPAFLEYWENQIGVNDVRVSDVMNRTGVGAESEFSVGDQITCGRRPCAQPRQRLVFSDNADFAFGCCHAWDGSFPVGNIRNQSLLDIWNGPVINKLRTALNNNKHDSIPMCKYGKCAAKETYVFKKNDTLQKVSTCSK